MQRLWLKIRYNLFDADLTTPLKPRVLITVIGFIGFVLLIQILILFNKAF